jgi:hypothetical protein
MAAVHLLAYEALRVRRFMFGGRLARLDKKKQGRAREEGATEHALLLPLRTPADDRFLYHCMSAGPPYSCARAACLSPSETLCWRFQCTESASQK